MMRTFGWLAIAPALLLAPPEPTPQELAANRARWAQLQQIPERAVTLRQAAKTFQSLPADRRDAILQFDHDLNEPDGKPLREVLARYVAWIDSLSADDRERIRQAPDRAKKLAVIRSIREQDWVKRQPKV